jgi:hypothetical protein
MTEDAQYGRSCSGERGELDCGPRAAVAIEPRLRRQSLQTGIFAVVAGDFCQNGPRILQLGSSETCAELQKPANGGPFSWLASGSTEPWNGWLAPQCRSHPSPRDFPANREFYREFRDSEASVSGFGARTRCAAATYRAIPCSN